MHEFFSFYFDMPFHHIIDQNNSNFLMHKWLWSNCFWKLKRSFVLGWKEKKIEKFFHKLTSAQNPENILSEVIVYWVDVLKILRIDELP